MIHNLPKLSTTKKNLNIFRVPLALNWAKRTKTILYSLFSGFFDTYAELEDTLKSITGKPSSFVDSCFPFSDLQRIFRDEGWMIKHIWNYLFVNTEQFA